MVNDISVEIKDPSPVVILFGGRHSGKTMALVRLTRYLQKKGYALEPNKTFRGSQSSHYKNACDQFMQNVYDEKAPSATGDINFLLMKVRKGGGGPMVCQILEAPGEHYFKTKDDQPLPSYIKRIAQDGTFRRIWIFLVEIDWLDEDPHARDLYAQKVASQRPDIKSKDKIILMCHKADRQGDLWIDADHPNMAEFLKKIKEQYAAIFQTFKTKSPIKRFFRPYAFDFIVFSSGTFSKVSDDSEEQMYNQSDDRHPRTLWNAILKNIRG